MERIFDPSARTARKERATRMAVPGADFLHARAVEDLSDRLSTIERRFARSAVLFDGSPRTAQLLAALPGTSEVERLEVCGPVLAGEAGRLGDPDGALPFDEASLDLAVALFAPGEVDDLPGLLVQIRRALVPDGLFLGCLAGAGTLGELRESLLAAEIEVTGGGSPRVHPFADVRDCGALLQRAGFALPVADVETLTVRYDTMFGLMRDLRAMGAANFLHGRLRRPTRRDVFLRAAEIYAERYRDPDGRVRATFNMVWLSGWAPAPTQQKPARRGSGAVSLADVLSVKGQGSEGGDR